MEKRQKTDLFTPIKVKINPNMDKEDPPFAKRKYEIAVQQIKDLGDGNLAKGLQKIEEAFEKANKQKSK